MSDTRFGRMQKAMALIPLALLSTAWTASLLTGGGSAAVATSADETRLPDGTTVPTEAIEDPASFSSPDGLGLGVPDGAGDRIVQTASTNGIPSAALSAYQRAATVINAADKGCNIPWQLVAAIGRVESDHGRYGGNTLGKDGVSRPGIYGVALDGSNKTQAISDTDAGQFDNDSVNDRAVGPMQFIPSTWAVVGVDADGDSKRNPQDIDDAALAAAVYLCSGKDDLSSEAGQKTAVHRYNHSDSYVDLVLGLTKAYVDGDFTSVPNNTTSAVTFTPNDSSTHAKPKNVNSPGQQPTVGKTPTTDTGTKGSTPTTPTTDPTDPTDPGNTNKPDDKGGNKPPPPESDPAKKVTDGLKDGAGKVKKGLEDTVKNTLSRTEALARCTVTNPLNILKCVNDLLAP